MPRRRWLAASLFVGALGVAAVTYALAESLRYAAAPMRIDVKATPITSFDSRDPARTRFGSLEFIGGLALTSTAEPFGGVSGLLMRPDGNHLLALTDNGSWLSARLVYRDGRPDGLADVEMAPILGADGKPLAARGWFDTESLTELNGKLYVGIERVHRIVRFDFAKDGVASRGQPIAVPSDFKTFPNNASLECLAAPLPGAAHTGKLIAVAEKALDAAGNHRGFIVDPAATDARVDADTLRFTVKRTDDFDIADCTVLPQGDLLLLERRYSPARGVAMRIRRVPLVSIKEGALVDGEILIDVDLAYQIDNMEGISLHKNAVGETVITLVSDDNFSVIQRNLLLQFVLIE